MRNLFKKSLATALAVIICLSAVVGVISVGVGAAETAVISAKDAEVGYDEATVLVDLTIEGDITVAELSYEAPEGYTLTDVTSETMSCAFNAEEKKFDAANLSGVDVTNPEIKLEFSVESAFKCEVDDNVTITLLEARNYYEQMLEITKDTAIANITGAGHVEAEAVKENEVAATCTATGSYDNVVYCSVCNEELSRETVVTDMIAHTYDNGVVTKDSTCTKEGVMTYTCTVCNDSYTEAISVKDHTPAEAVKENVVEATCTATGSYDSVVYCSVCHTQISRKTITTPVIAHTVVVDAAVEATCTTTGLTEGSHCSVCNEVLVAQEVILVKEHEINYTDNGDGTHKVNCTKCDFSEIQEHKYDENGECVCGAEEETGPVYNSSVKVQAKNALFQSDYSLMFAIPTSTAEGWYLVVEQDQYNGNTKIDPRVVTLTVDDLYNTQNVNGVQCYTLLLNGIGAKNVASEVKITLYATINGVLSYGDTESYNLVTYATNAIRRTNQTAKQQKFAKAMVAFLNYAASAQTRFSYNTTNLANAGLTETEKEMAPLTTEPVNYRNDSYAVIDNPTASILAYAPQYKDKMTLSVLVDAPADDDYTLQIEYNDYKGTKQSDSAKIADGTDTNYNGAIRKQIDFTTISFGSVRSNVTLKVVDSNGTIVSNTGLYSFESYAASRKTTSADYEASRELINFGDYIKIYYLHS